MAALLQLALLLVCFETGWAARVSRAVYGGTDGKFRAGLDLEFAAALAHIDLALVYGLALPIVLPLAPASQAVPASLRAVRIRLPLRSIA